MNVRTSIPCPNGLTLDVSRVGQDFVYPDTARKGETVEFYYSHGSHNGTRTVLVMKNDSQGIEGITLERDGEYRRYSDDYVSNGYKVVNPFVDQPKVDTTEKRVRFDDALEALRASLTGEQLADLYNTHVALEGVGATFDGATGEVVVKLPQPRVAHFVLPTSNNHTEIVNKRGEHLQLWIYKVGAEWCGFSTIKDHSSNITPEQLRDELVKFLA